MTFLFAILLAQAAQHQGKLSQGCSASIH